MLTYFKAILAWFAAQVYWVLNINQQGGIIDSENNWVSLWLCICVFSSFFFLF